MQRPEEVVRIKRKQMRPDLTQIRQEDLKNTRFTSRTIDTTVTSQTQTVEE